MKSQPWPLPQRALVIRTDSDTDAVPSWLPFFHAFEAWTAQSILKVYHAKLQVK